MDKFIRALLELGQNAVLAVVLVAFGVSAKFTPSLLDSVGTWNRIGTAAIVLGVVWAAIAVGYYLHTIKVNFSGHKRERLVSFAGLVIGLFVLACAMMVVPPWTMNGAAMRYCAGKPDPKDAETCRGAFKIP